MTAAVWVVLALTVAAAASVWVNTWPVDCDGCGDETGEGRGER